MYKIKIVQSHSVRIPYGYNSWLDYWERKSGQKATICHRSLCYDFRNLTGVHVIKVDKTHDDNFYIVPLCENHNKCFEEFNVEGPLTRVN